MKKTGKIIISFLLLVIVSMASLFMYKSHQSQKMSPLSTYTNSQLGVCSHKPNCVSSFQSKKDLHYIEPIGISKIDVTKLVLPENCLIFHKLRNYIQATCTSSLFAFVDDLEILFNERDSQLHFRSSSRVGHSDLGANRKRILTIIANIKKP
jgi:uncharacterized protein (DUF1499 family)